MKPQRTLSAHVVAKFRIRSKPTGTLMFSLSTVASVQFCFLSADRGSDGILDEQHSYDNKTVKCPLH